MKYVDVPVVAPDPVPVCPPVCPEPLPGPELNSARRTSSRAPSRKSVTGLAGRLDSQLVAESKSPAIVLTTPAAAAAGPSTGSAGTGLGAASPRARLAEEGWAAGVTAAAAEVGNRSVAGSVAALAAAPG